MQEQIFQAQYLIGIIWKRRWLAFSIMAIVCLVGWTIVFLLPNKYEASTRLYINKETILTPLLKGLAVDSNVTQATANMMRRTLLSRPNLEKVLKETDLGLLAETDTEREKLLGQLSEQIVIKASGDRGEIYSISYQDVEAQRATSVVKKLLDIFINEILIASKRDTNITELFLDKQIKVYEERLIKAEDELKIFKRQHLGVMSTQDKTYFEQLQAVKDTLRQSKLDMEEAINKKNELRRQINSIKASLSSSSPDADKKLVTPLSERINALEAKLDDLLLNFTEDHPDVISTRRVLEELKTQRTKELENMRHGVNNQNLEANPAYSELTVELGKTQGEIAALSVRVKEYESRVKELSSLIDTIPEVEAQLARLNRDYDVNKRNYEELVSRRESASISQEAESNTDQLQFQIIEPPIVPLIPVSPNRIKLSSIVLVLGIASGLVFAWLMAQIKPTFQTVRDLRAKYELPVIGSISFVYSDGEKSKINSEMIRFGSTASLLIISFLVVLYWHMTH
jgi:polysaccharide chain length determinant protein (PEP-CTERM system associated)